VDFFMGADSMALPDYSIVFWICAVSAVILVGIAKAGFGGGVGVVATPILALTVPVTDAAALMLPLLILCDLFSVSHYRTNFDRRSVTWLLPGAMLGIALGAFAFGYFQGNEHILKVGIGILAIAFVLYQALRRVIEGALERHDPSAFEGVLLGGLSGFTSTLAHAGGPPIAIYLLPQQLPRERFVGTTVIYFAAVNAVKLVPYQYLGLLTVGNLSTILLLSPLTYVGVRLGIFLNQRFNDTWFNRLIYAVLFVTGIKLILG
jgi:uncharacterized membrane protein YfcA